MRESFYDTNGITLHVLDYPGSGPTVLMLHGLTANAHFFPDLANLVAGDFRVVAINLRGRGRSEKPPSHYTMEDHANDVLGVMDKLKLDSAHLCGHSYGGLLTYYLAAHHRDRVDRCVVLDAPADVDANVLEQIQPALDRLTKMFPSWDEFLDEMRALPYYQGWWEPSIEDYFKSDVIRQVDGRCRPRIHPDHIKQCVEGTLDIDWPKLVGTVAQPTLLIRCADPFGPEGSPPMLTAEAAAQTVAVMPNATTDVVPGNHMTAFFGEAAANVAPKITDFLVG